MFYRSRRNLVRWFTLSMGSILVLFAAVAYYQEVISELAKVDRLLYQKTQVMVSNIRYRFRDKRWQLYLENVPLLGTKTTPVDNELSYARWYNGEKQLVQFFGAPAPDYLSTETGLKTINITAPEDGAGADFRLRQLTVAVYRDDTPVGYLQVAVPLTTAQTTLTEFRLFMAIAVPVGLALISLVSYVLGGHAMQPIHQVNRHLACFTADVSHELRTPLTGILNTAHVELLSDDINLEHRSRLQKIVDLAELMSRLISHLLLLARYQGAIDPQLFTTVNLNHLLYKLVENTLVQQRPDPELTYLIPSTPIIVRAAPHLLQQAMGCLLDNAFKYTPADGKIQLRLLTQAHQAVIEVEDTGIGIPPEELPHIFERFYRVDKDRSRQTGGFGLGLAIAHQIITAHHGFIQVTSVIGQGSLFKIVLPLKEI